MAIEIDKAGVGKYFNRYRDNALYYQNSLKYIGGELYRAVLGYDIIWDKKAERNLMICLDYLLTNLNDKNKYYFEELTVTKDVTIHGVTWHRGIAPRKLSFALQWLHNLKQGEPILARINCLDRPYHVDIELIDGTVFTIQFQKYLRYRENLLRGTRRNEKQKQSKTNDGIKSSTRPSLKLVKKHEFKKPGWKIPSKLSCMRKAF